jgi:methylated-DNA-[protein]-cysteine S-methyltransferase
MSASDRRAVGRTLTLEVMMNTTQARPKTPAQQETGVRAPVGYTLFDTAIGRCGIAWGERGIVGLLLPEATDGGTRARLQRRFPAGSEAALPPEVARVVEAITALLNGDAVDLSDVELDMDGVPPFHRRVYDVVRAIPPGGTMSYGEVAAWAGAPGAARAVGQALGNNPFAIVVPCHRVLAAGGRIGGFSAEGGITTKRRLLAIEGTEVKGAPTA